MNLTEILRSINSQNKTDEQIKLIWFLQSLTLEDGGEQRFVDEVYQWFPEAVNVFSYHLGRNENTLESLIDRLVGTYDRPTAKAVELLMDYMNRSEAEGRQRFYQTNIGRTVWETLDWCLEERRPCFIEGLEGRGKSASTQAWVRVHRGEARYVSVPGTGVQRDFFATLAHAYGVPHSYATAPNQIRFRICDVIKRSGLVLILDESHFLMPERTSAGRPRMIDFINTELCNAGVAVALISTPQFGPRLAEFEARTSWNSRQFKRRFSGCWRRLADKTDEADLAALALKVMPHIGKKGVELAVSFAGAFGRDVSGLFDLIRDAQRRARKAGRTEVSFQNLRDAYDLDRVPSESAMAEAFKRPVDPRLGGRLSDPLPDENAPETDAVQQRSSSAAMVPPSRVGSGDLADASDFPPSNSPRKTVPRGNANRVDMVA